MQDDDGRDECPHCGEPVTTTGETDQGWERGTCFSCALQTIRPVGERWRAIRG